MNSNKSTGYHRIGKPFIIAAVFIALGVMLANGSSRVGRTYVEGEVWRSPNPDKTSPHKDVYAKILFSSGDPGNQRAPGGVFIGPPFMKARWAGKRALPKEASYSTESFHNFVTELVRTP